VTESQVRYGSLGDPDAVLVGDLHVPHQVCFALAGEERGSDERMIELLEPFAGHRGRVQRMIGWSGIAAPRRAPRYSPIRSPPGDGTDRRHPQDTPAERRLYTG